MLTCLTCVVGIPNLHKPFHVQTVLTGSVAAESFQTPVEQIQQITKKKHEKMSQCIQCMRPLDHQVTIAT